MTILDTLTVHQESDVLAEVELKFVETNGIYDGTCSCVCINDERCCGCIFQ